jgi:predicted ATPase/DNA-binding SARP family transcriptional activator
MVEEALELRICLLGGFRVSLGDQNIPASRWRLAKARHLVKLLALADGHHLHREQLMELLWPELDPAAAANNLYQVLYTSRRILDSSGLHRYLLLQEEILYLCPEEPLWIDVEAFQAAASKARSSLQAADYQAALNLYFGDLLPEDRYADWADEPRQSLRQEYQSLKLAYAHILEKLGDYAAAIEALHEIHTADPACEEAHVGLMRCYALVGQRQQALRLYQTLKEVLRRELEVDPSPESTHLYQEILTGQFPPRYAFDKERLLNNLPHQLTSFIGRKVEIDRVKQLLTASRLVTLTGAGGVGKTRLALKVAEDLQGEYPQGIWLIDLAPLVDPHLILPAVATQFGVQESKNRPLMVALFDYLLEKRVLLLLDNCEHLIADCAQLAEQLLQTCPNVHILTTSREVLGISGEMIFSVPPLSVPGPGQQPILDKLEKYDALRLFIARAASSQPEFGLNTSNAGDILQICQRLDALPLALELAAARVRTLSVHQIAARLDNVFSLLVGGSRTALPRHQNLQALIDWSYRLLSEDEQKLFRRLSVFEGGWTLEAAVVVCGSGDGDVCNLLPQLSDKSMVVVRSKNGEVPRYFFLETIRQYARARLVGSGEVEQVHDNHLEYFLRWVVDIAPKLRTDQGLILDNLDEEISNLRLALRWALEEAPDLRVAQGSLMAAGLLLYWYQRGSIREGLNWLKKGLGLIDRDQADFKHILGDVCLAVGVLQEDIHQEEACHFLEESIRFYQEAGDQSQAAHALCQLGHALVNVDPSQITNVEIEKALCFAEQGLSISRQLGDKWSLAFALCMNAVIVSKSDAAASIRLMKESYQLFEQVGDRLFMAMIKGFFSSLALQQGDYAAAFYDGQQSLELARAQKSKYVVMQHLSSVGMAAWYLEDYPQMIICFEQKLVLSRELGDKAAIAVSLRSLGMAALRQGQIPEAAAFFLEALRKDQEAGYFTVQNYLLWFAGVALAFTKPEQAARWIGALDSGFKYNRLLTELWDQQEYKHYLSILPAQFGEGAFKAVFEEGQALSLDEALIEAIDLGREASQSN